MAGVQAPDHAPSIILRRPANQCLPGRDADDRRTLRVVPRLDHVNLGVPVDGLDQEAAFLVDLLGYRRVEGGPEAQGFGTLWWFEGDDAAQVHLSADPDHRPPGRAHTAIHLGDALDSTLDRLRGAGHECGEIAFDGDRHVFTRDPAGNTWELIGPVPAGAAATTSSSATS